MRRATANAVAAIAILLAHAPVAWAQGHVATPAELARFFRSVQLDDPATVQEMLVDTISPNQLSPAAGEPALVLAVREGSMKVFGVLMQQPRIDLETPAVNGNTALMMAAFRNNAVAAHALLARGAVVSRPGWTALHYAATGGSVDIGKALLERGADIDAPSPSGMTPLMMAAREGQEEMVRLLLACGANASLRDGGFHQTAAEFALKADKPWIAKAIDSFQASQPTR
jgi:ankyrin repeat protein